MNSKRYTLLFFKLTIIYIILFNFLLIFNISYPYCDDFWHYLTITKMIINETHIPIYYHNIDFQLNMTYPPVWFLLCSIFSLICGTTYELFIVLKVLSFLIPILIFILFYNVIKYLFKKSIVMISSLLLVFSINSGAYFGLFYPSPAVLEIIMILSYFLFVIKFLKTRVSKLKSIYLFFSITFLFLSLMTHFLAWIIYIVIFFTIIISYVIKIIFINKRNKLLEIKKESKEILKIQLISFYVSIALCYIFWCYNVENIKVLFGFFSSELSILIFYVYISFPLIFSTFLFLFIKFFLNRNKKDKLIIFLVLNMVIIGSFLFLSIIYPEYIFQSLYEMDVQSNFWLSYPDPQSLNIPIVIRDYISIVYQNIPLYLLPFLYWLLILNPLIIIISFIGIFKVLIKYYKRKKNGLSKYFLVVVLYYFVISYLIIFINYGVRLILFILPIIAIFFSVGYLSLLKNSGKKTKILKSGIIFFVLSYNTILNYQIFSDPWATQSLLITSENINENLNNNNNLILTFYDHRSYHPFFYLKLTNGNYYTHYASFELNDTTSLSYFIPNITKGDFLFITSSSYNIFKDKIEYTRNCVKYFMSSENDKFYCIYIWIK
ncbi:MAG: hypothetical protein ACTSPY_03260 [Candidatus Helarchaeota archaeon]